MKEDREERVENKGKEENYVNEGRGEMNEWMKKRRMEGEGMREGKKRRK